VQEGDFGNKYRRFVGSPHADAGLLTQSCNSANMRVVGKAGVDTRRYGKSTEGGSVEEIAVVDRCSYGGCVGSCACCCSETS